MIDGTRDARKSTWTKKPPLPPLQSPHQKNLSNKSSLTELRIPVSASAICPQTEDRQVEIVPNLTIYVLLGAEKSRARFGVPTTRTIAEFRIQIADYFQYSADSIQLHFDSDLAVTDENVTFYSLNLRSRTYLDVVLTTVDNNMEVVAAFKARLDNDPKRTTDTTIFVHHRRPPDLTKVDTSLVEVEVLNYTKHFIGGFKHKSTGKEYHHAATQTRARPKKLPQDEMFSRDTQTHRIRNRSIDNVVTTSTQMTGTGYYVSNWLDRIVEPGQYQTADELEAYILAKVIIIQKYYRRWLAKRRVAQLRAIRQLILDYQMAEQNRKAADKDRRLRELYDKRRCPLYDDDFDLLYHAVEKWRLRQLAVIDEQALRPSEQKALHCRVMDEQHDWLVAIDNLKNNAVKILNFRAKKNKLIKVSKPIVWQDKFGDEIRMDYVETTRGRQVFEVYKSLCMDYFNEEERLDILLTLKRLIRTFSVDKTALELIGLINRETDLIMRNVQLPLLKGLRTRISSLFLILCRKPSFNPGVAKYLKAPQNPLTLRGTFQLCRICSRYLKNSQFMFSVMSKRLGACRTCTRLYNHAIPRHELSPYRHILGVLRRTEEEYQDYSKMAFVFSEIDIKHLITRIWDSRSIISSNIDLENVIFIRWIRNTEWSPWNTALMTYDEADAHYKLEDPCAAYEQTLLDRVHQKQIMGHQYFSALNELASTFVVHNKQEQLDIIEAAKIEDKNRFIEERKQRFEQT